MKKLMSALLFIILAACSPGHNGGGSPYTPPQPPKEDNNQYFPIASAIISVSSYGDIAAMAKKKGISIASLFMSTAFAEVAQGSATVNVIYTNPSVTAFTINTASFGNAMTVTGDELNMGTISLSSLDDNSLKVCTGVGAPQNKCNRLYIRVFTLGTATGGITNTAGFINTSDPTPYGIDVLAGSVLTPIGFNSSPTAGTITNAAVVHTYVIPSNMNRVRLSNISAPSIPVKADLSNAGSGNYEMNLVVQYALGYQ